MVNPKLLVYLNPPQASFDIMPVTLDEISIILQRFVHFRVGAQAEEAVTDQQKPHRHALGDQGNPIFFLVLAELKENRP